jgi:PIN domain nuclease of toxin-antitoxin system
MPLYVSDTHPLLWYASGARAKLSKRALRIFEDASGAEALIYIPAIALWEASIVLKGGRVPLHEPFEDWASALLSQPGFDLAPLDLEVIADAAALGFTNDPFDAAIVATARVKGLPLITKDSAISESGLVDIAW